MVDAVFSNWIKGEVGTDRTVVHATRGRVHYLALRHNFIDAQTATRRIAGCVAVRVNRVLILAREFSHFSFYDELKAAGEAAQYGLVEIPTLTTIRSVIAGVSIPSRDKWEYALRSMTKKVFREKIDVEGLRQLKTLRDLVPKGASEIMSRAHMTNAFKFEGRMTHVAVRGTNLVAYFPNDDDAVLWLMNQRDVKDLSIVEIV